MSPILLEESVPVLIEYFDGISLRSSLRLQIFRGLGFEPVLDKDGSIEKMLVGMCSASLFMPSRLIGW